MTDHLDHMRFQALIQRIRPGGSIVRAWPLTGGITNTMTAVEIKLPAGGAERLVIRRFGRRVTSATPNIATIEHTLLGLLAQAGVSAPRPIYLDANHEFSIEPLVVVSHIDGSPDLSGIAERVVCEQLAGYLTSLHAISSTSCDLSFLPALTERIARLLTFALIDGVMTPTLTSIRQALGSMWPPLPARPAVVLHGDFWPGNVLWRDGRFAAAVDWEDAVAGDPLFDVASVRLELLWLFGENALQDFTEHYLAATGISPAELPFWDLCAALDPALNLSTWDKEPAVEQHMHAELARFVDRAVAALAPSVGTPGTESGSDSTIHT